MLREGVVKKIEKGDGMNDGKKYFFDFLREGVQQWKLKKNEKKK